MDPPRRRSGAAEAQLVEHRIFADARQRCQPAPHRVVGELGLLVGAAAGEVFQVLRGERAGGRVGARLNGGGGDAVLNATVGGSGSSGIVIVQYAI